MFLNSNIASRRLDAPKSYRPELAARIAFQMTLLCKRRLVSRVSHTTTIIHPQLEDETKGSRLDLGARTSRDLRVRVSKEKGEITIKPRSMLSPFLDFFCTHLLHMYACPASIIICPTINPRRTVANSLRCVFFCCCCPFGCWCEIEVVYA